MTRASIKPSAVQTGEGWKGDGYGDDPVDPWWDTK